MSSSFFSSKDSTDSNILCSTGFARRLSKRMKHLPVPEEPSVFLDQGIPEKPEPPPDSAYSSGPDEKLNPMESQKESKQRPESTLGPLPVRIDEPKYSSRAASSDQISKPDGAMSVKSIASTSRSRTLSIRSFLPRRWRSGKVLAA